MERRRVVRNYYLLKCQRVSRQRLVTAGVELNVNRRSNINKAKYVVNTPPTIKAKFDSA